MRRLRGLVFGGGEAQLAVGAVALLLEVPEPIAQRGDLVVEAHADEGGGQHRERDHRGDQDPHRVTRASASDNTSATLNRAGLARGLALTSSSVGRIAFFVTTFARPDAHPFRERLLHRALLPAVERDHRDARAEGGERERGTDPAGHVPRLVVHRDAQSLEGPRRGIDARGVASHDAKHRRADVADRAHGPRRDQRPRDRARAPLAAVFEEDLRERRLGEAVDEVCGGLPRRRGRSACPPARPRPGRRTRGRGRPAGGEETPRS